MKSVDREDFAGVGDRAGDGGGGDHDRTHEHGAAGGRTLAALEIAVGGAGAELVADELVGVHREAHGAPGGAPLEARLGKHLVDAFLLALERDDLRTGDSDGLDPRGDLAALDVLGDLPEVRETAVSAGAKEGDVDFGALDW